VSPGDLKVSENFDAPQLEQHFRDISDRVAPAVVAISATEGPASPSRAAGQDINGDRLASMLSSVDRTVGTGFVVDPDGYIITNDHVVAEAQELWITTDDRKVYPAVVVGADPWADLAVLKIPATHLATARFADGSRARRGQWTIALGNPYGLSTRGQMCASVGIVSAVDQSLARLSDKEDRLYSNLIQTTAQINPGNSGGPLLDLAGDVIGINTAVILPQRQVSGIGFAIPTTHRLELEIDSIEHGHQIIYGYLGAHVSTPTARERQEAGVAEEAAVRVDSIDEASPATGRLLAGDVVVRFDDQMVENADQFARLIGDAPIGRSITALVSRRGSMQSIALALRARDASVTTTARESQRLRWRGLLLAPIPSNWPMASEDSADRGSAGVMILAVDERTPLHANGLRPGSILTAIDGQAVTDLAQLQRLLASASAGPCNLQLAQGDGAAPGESR
jgi:S1-C subfamily serine protease